MTESEIMKALECCKAYNYDACSECPFNRNADCAFAVATNCLDLINRKNAEIERLKKMKSIGTTDWLTKGMSAEQIAEKKAKAIAECNAEIRAEAIKEYKERVKKLIVMCNYDLGDLEDTMLMEKDIDQIAKEMGVEL